MSESETPIDAALMLSYSQLSKRLNELMTARGEYCGVPMPIEGMPMTLQENYPHPELATLFEKPRVHVCTQSDIDLDYRDTEIVIELVNHWYCRSRRCEITITRTRGADDRVHTRLIKHAIAREDRLLDVQMHSLGACDAYDADAETTAMLLLDSLIGEARMRQYMFRGAFVEISKRSRVCYLFRRGRPTIAFRVVDERGIQVMGDEVAGQKRMLCALCMHPIGYYQRSFSGAMTPTDDVIAHLTLMRGDEHMLWRRCNQHSIDSPEAAL